jgi:predicted RecA/RadA family phage recombinase
MATKIQEGATVDYTPGSDVTAGDVVVQSKLVGVALVDIASGEKGALAVEGVFEFTKASGDGGIAAGDLVYWDDAENVAKEDSESAANELIGKCVEAAGDTAVLVKIRLDQ